MLDVSDKTIAVGCDHAAFELKGVLLSYLRERGLEPVDFGCYDTQSVHYPDIGARVAKAISFGELPRGILLCGTGVGMSITANKFPRIRAALCHNEFTAQASREHNDANILVMGARVLTDEQALKITALWLDTHFTEGRHAERVAKISELEDNLQR